jgi:hypothetical protein
MRYPIYGNGIASSSVKVWEPGSLVAATVYTEEVGGLAVSDSVITADATGKFVFFVDDSDYPVISYFDIYFYASGNTQPGVWSFFIDATGATPPTVPTPDSTVTELQIINAALMANGVAPLVALTDVSVQADVVRTWYPLCRDALLRDHPWNFAEKRTLLTAVVGSAPAMDFARFFNLPTDCIRLRRLSDESVDVAYKVEGRRIVCDEAAINILYTFRETDTRYYSPLFVDCLVAMLAWRISYPLRKDLNLEKAKEATYKSTLVIAKGVDAQEGTPDVPMADDLLIVR